MIDHVIRPGIKQTTAGEPPPPPPSLCSDDRAPPSFSDNRQKTTAHKHSSQRLPSVLHLLSCLVFCSISWQGQQQWMRPCSITMRLVTAVLCGPHRPFHAEPARIQLGYAVYVDWEPDHCDWVDEFIMRSGFFLRLGPWLIDLLGCVLRTMHLLDYYRRDSVLQKMEAANRTSP